MSGTDALRFLTWNLRHGGGPRSGRLAEIVLALLRHKPDVVVLTEFHSSRGGSVRGLLADAGLIHQLCSGEKPCDADRNAILIAARVGLRRENAVRGFPAGETRFLDCTLPDHPVAGRPARLTGVHLPDDSKAAEKLASWHALIDLARARREEPWILLGDFNSGRHKQDESGKAFRATALLGTFSSLGMLDAWRHLNPESRERSWSHPARGSTRIDACYLSSPIHKCLKNSHFSHEERHLGLSDHSALIVDIEGLGSPVGCVAGTPHRPLAPATPAPDLLFPAWKTALF